MLKPDSRRLNGCRLCGAPFFPFKVDLGSSPTANQLHSSLEDAKSANRYGLEIGMCSNCKHIQLMEIVNPEILFSDYIYRSGTSATFVSHFTDLAKELASVSLPINYVLEVGSNDGTLMSKFDNFGIKAIGIEPSSILADDCNRVGLETICGYFDVETLRAIVEQRGNPTVIVGNNVFAHIDDLNSAFECARKYLDPEGYFVFEVADVSRIIRDGIFDTIYHEHMSYHSLTSMIPLADAHGFTIARIDFIPTHGGSFRFYLTVSGSVDPNLNLGMLLEEERALGLDSEEGLKAIATQINKIRNQVALSLREISEGTDTLLIGYGAPAKVVTFLSALGIEDIPILGIIDDNEYKQGKFLPSSGIKILSQSNLLSEIDSHYKNFRIVCLVFPWNLGVELRNKIADLLPSGSKMITFFPEVSEVEL